MATPTTFDRIDVQQARSVAFGLVAAGFRYPDETLQESLVERDGWQAWSARLGQIDPAFEVKLQALQQTVRSAPLETLETRFVALFGHAVRGTCPPYELEYGRSEIIQQTSFLADIAGFYTAFGLELTGDGHERLDHLSVECEFLAVMAAKEAYALELHDVPALEAVRQAQSKFLQDHLGRWFPSFARRVVEADAGGFYGKLAGFAEALIQSDCRRFGLAGEPTLFEPQPAELPEDSAMTCGVEESCPDARGDDLVQIRTGSAPEPHGREVHHAD